MQLKTNFSFEPTFEMLEATYDCEYTIEQKRILQQGFANGVDIHKYANPKLKWTYTDRIRQALERGIDISKYISPDYVHQVIEIIYML